jgi:4-oxalocrotonate tautomerase
LAADIADVIVRHLGSKDSSVSVALTRSTRTRGKAKYGIRKSGRRWTRLIKKPGYQM